MCEKSDVFETKTFAYRSLENIMIYVERGDTSMKEVYAVLDIGSATLKLFVGEIINSNVMYLFLKQFLVMV